MASRWIPWVIAGGLGIVVAVNAALAYLAVASSTGLVSKHAFTDGTGYNRVLDAGAAQDALGWRGVIGFLDGGAGRGELTALLTDRDGAPLAGLAVTARMERPVEPLPPIVVKLAETAAGRYAGAAEPSRPGQWEVRVAARRGDDLFEFANRVFVK